MLEHIDIHAADHCNFSCADCGHFSPHYSEKFHDAEEYISDLRRLHALVGIKHVYVTGGEPTLNPEIFTFLKKIRSAGSWKVRIVTNGWWKHKFPEWETILLDLVDELCVSIHPQLHLPDAPNVVFGKNVDIVRTNEAKRWHTMQFAEDWKCNKTCDWYIYNCLVLRSSRLYRCPVIAYASPELVSKNFWNTIDSLDVKKCSRKELIDWQDTLPECCGYCRVSETIGIQGSDAEVSNTEKIVSMEFDHGLGDCSNMAHLLMLYASRGYKLYVKYHENKTAVWEAINAKAPLPGQQYKAHPWSHFHGFNVPEPDKDWSGNKVYLNINAELPELGNPNSLWEELCSSRIDPLAIVDQRIMREVADAFFRIPKPIVLIHSRGTTSSELKSLTDNTVKQLYYNLLDNFPGTIILLDWDYRVPEIHHPRILHMHRQFGHLDCYHLHAMFLQADLLIGVDSGPLHFARIADIPSVGVFLHYYPSCVSLPRGTIFNLTSQKNRNVNIFRRKRWNIGEYPGDAPAASDIAIHALRMLNGCRYLRSAKRVGRDVQLQQWVRDWLQYFGRSEVFDTLLQECTRRFQNPRIIETGCVRKTEDWSAGYSTFIFGAYLEGLGSGLLSSIDNSFTHCETARQITDPWDNYAEIICSDSVTWLTECKDNINVLYLDSMDADIPGHAEHGLRELQVAYPKLSEESLIVFDDTYYNAGWIGKGALGVPYLLERGWKCLEDKNQILLYKGMLTTKKTGIF